MPTKIERVVRAVSDLRDFALRVSRKGKAVHRQLMQDLQSFSAHLLEMTATPQETHPSPSKEPKP